MGVENIVFFLPSDHSRRVEIHPSGTHDVMCINIAISITLIISDEGLAPLSPSVATSMCLTLFRNISVRRRTRAAGAGDRDKYQADNHFPHPVFRLVEPRVGDHLPNRQDDHALHSAAVAHVCHLLPDRPGPVEVGQHTRSYRNCAHVQRKRLQRLVPCSRRQND